MELLARSLSKSLRLSTPIQSWVRRCHSSSSSTSHTLGTCEAGEESCEASDQKRKDLGTDHWLDLLEKPEEWCDFRQMKQNGSISCRFPDFKKTDWSVSLWVNKSPKEILPKLKDLQFGVDHWFHILEKPSEWLDWRKKKQDGSPLPDFRKRDGTVMLWLNKAPNEILSQLTNLKCGADDWYYLLDKPDEWCDYRKRKQDGSVCPKHPDFKKKDGSVKLWLNKAPDDILSKLKEVKFGVDHWFDLLEKPDEWCDNRESKQNGSVGSKYPDFQKKDGTAALWLNKAPDDILFKLNEKKSEAGEELWHDLIVDLQENGENWWDNRMKKKNAKGPDFRHKQTRVGLWLKDCPRFLLDFLPPPKWQ